MLSFYQLFNQCQEEDFENQPEHFQVSNQHILKASLSLWKSGMQKSALYWAQY
jgi:hypothetical protein